MIESAVSGLLQNAAALLAMIVIFDVATGRRRLEGTTVRGVIVGAALGAIGITLMLESFAFEDGVIVDLRSVLLATSGLFFGALPAVVAMATTTVFRLFQGGAAAPTGVAVIVATGCIGIVWRLLRRGPLADISARELFGFGVIVHVVMLALMLTLPRGTAQRVLTSITLPVLLVYPAATMALGLLLAGRLRRERTTAALSESEARFRTLFTQSPVGMSMTLPDGTLDRVNPAFAHLLGYAPEELAGRSVASVTHPDDQFESFECMRRLLDGESDTCFVEKRYLTKDGGTVRAQTHATLERDARGQPLRILSLILDIAERAKAEAAVRDSEAQLRALFQTASIGLAQADVHTGRWTRVNDSLCQITGYSAEEMLALHVPEITHPEDRARDWEAFQRVVRGDEPSYRLEKRYLRKDGSPVWVNVNMTVVRDAGGRPVRTIASIEDISERKGAESRLRALLAEIDASRRVLLSVVEDQQRAEAARSRLNDELEQRVLSRTAELAAANQDLDSFAYAVSHDLRAPLRAMSGFSLAILEDDRDRLSEEARGHLEHIRKASQDMSQLIDGLLALSRSTRGDLRRDRVDLSAMAERLCGRLERAEPSRGVAWSVEPGLTVWADPRMLEAALRNLLDNAWKYTARSATPSVRIYAERDGGQLQYCVADNGVGFDMRHADRLFTPFQRLHRHDEFPGIGIGLATVKRVVHRHGGTLSATAAVGRGATFRFHLPAPEPEAGVS